ncbi:MAG: bifunctional folylpolyglutamate synthase/dihydrofolate synthase [Candidatus Atribacteria bacterium]|nr:bifunctional folylpolyglutamate synthase/dihydrofolate synthase [Candidatus Atribacteria bacterium]
MKYREAIQYLYNLIDYEKAPLSYSDLKLERVRELMERIGNPQKRFPVILVAGTKGKGSTAYFLMRLFSSWGFRCGFHSKPHLFTFRERIRVGETCIPPQDVALLLEYLIPTIEDMEQHSPFGRPTYFEVSVAMALLYFYLQEVDVAVVEVGLGGRLDATNICDPSLTVITPISFDHMEILGDTLSKIAREKAGILRKDVKLILAPQEEEAKSTLFSEASRKGSPVYPVERFCRYEVLARGIHGSSFRWEVEGWGGGENHLPLLGDHQIVNLMTAFLAGKEWGLPFHKQNLEKALEGTRWPGRIEVLSWEPLVVFDVAHNQASFAQLISTLKNFLRVSEAIFLLGFLKGKEYWKIAEEVAPQSQRIILTRPLNPKATDPLEIAPCFEKRGISVEVVEDPFEAREIALQHSKENNLPLVVAGSFYLARPFMKEFSSSHEEEVEIC